MNVLNKGSLGRRILKRLLSLIIVVWGVVTLSFCLQVFTGTDPAEMIVRKNSLFATEEQIQAVREQLGLDAPFHERYIDYIKGVATGDLGTAITNRQPVIENIKDALPVTCTMIIMAMAWVILFTVILSAISVIRKNGIFDNVTRIVCIIGICVPSFWLALILLTAFAVNIPIFSVIADGSMPANAPKTMMPSSAMFRTPLRSENRSPRPTRSSGTRKISVCWQIKINRFIYFSAPFPVWCTSVLWRSCHLRMPSRMMKENALK